MSIDYIQPSIAIKRLKTARAYISKTKNDFKIWGAGEFAKAQQSSYFSRDDGGSRNPVLVVAVGSNTGSTIHLQSSGEANTVHNIDVHLIAPLHDRRGQFRDEESVWFKQFLIQSLHAFNPSNGSMPLIYSGDNLVEIAGVAGYARTYTFTQEMIVSECDVWGGDENEIEVVGDLDEFLQAYTDIFTEAPPLGDVSDASELDIELR